jgi:hypothetical protein
VAGGASLIWRDLGGRLGVLLTRIAGPRGAALGRGWWAEMGEGSCV